MQVILNIGLDSKTLGKIPAYVATSAARLAWLDVDCAAVHQSNTERTLVLTGSFSGPVGSLNKTIDSLSSSLGQDCIGVYLPESGDGSLVGPNAAAWGDFNPEYFILHDGSILSSSAIPA